jgi:hypothetical protein
VIRPIRTSTTQSNYEFIVALDGVDYILRFLWNSRIQRWYLTVKSAADVDLITGRKICVDIPWASHETIDGVPAGQLWTTDPSGSGIDPGLRELGERVVLLYVDEESVG